MLVDSPASSRTIHPRTVLINFYELLESCYQTGTNAGEMEGVVFRFTLPFVLPFHKPQSNWILLARMPAESPFKAWKSEYLSRMWLSMYKARNFGRIRSPLQQH